MELHYGRPLCMAGRQEREIRVYDFLDKLGIEYWQTDHERPAYTMEDCLEVDSILQATVCKNLFLCNHQKTHFYLLMIPEYTTFRTKDFSHQLGISRVSFAPEEQMLEFLDIHPGAVSVMGLMNDHENHVQLVIDKRILEGKFLGCHPCVNTSSLKIRTTDIIEKFLPAVKHDYKIVNLEENHSF